MFTIAIVSLSISCVCMLIIAADVTSRKQNMWIMNMVWPVTALYSGPLGLWAYFAIGRAPLSNQITQPPI